MKPVQKIRVYEKTDRQAIAAILVANGYAVWQGKELKQVNKRSSEYFVYFTEPDDEMSSENGGDESG